MRVVSMSEHFRSDETGVIVHADELGPDPPVRVRGPEQRETLLDGRVL
jgi:hypothetical protein